MTKIKCISSVPRNTFWHKSENNFYDHDASVCGLIFKLSLCKATDKCQFLSHGTLFSYNAYNNGLYIPYVAYIIVVFMMDTCSFV